MIESRKLIPASELRRLRIGSYEEKISEAAAVARVLFGDAPCEIIATRENDVVVYSDGKFFRMELREDGPALSDLGVEVFDSSNVHTFVEREAETIAGLFMEGAVNAATRRLRNLVPVVPTKRDALAQVEFVAAAPREWRRIFEVRSKAFGRFVGDDLSGLEEAQLRPQFEKLYDGSINEGKLKSYSDRVAGDLKTVAQRLERMHEDTAAALASVQDQLSDPSEGAAVLGVYKGFAEDLVDDLRLLDETFSHALEAVDDVGARGRLHDVAVVGLHEREVASRFVVVVADRMAN
jgi:hypothetical protein